MASQGNADAGVIDKTAMEELEKGDVNSGSVDFTVDSDNKRMTRNILWKLDTR